MDNLNTPDNMSKNTHTKLFKLQFSGASGNNTKWLTNARKPLETKGFRAFYVLAKILLQYIKIKALKGIAVDGYQVKIACCGFYYLRQNLNAVQAV